jgi:hypothetical protein
MWAIFFRVLSVGSLLATGDKIGEWYDSAFGSKGSVSGSAGSSTLGELSSLIKWLVIGGVLYVIYSLIGKKIKIGGK